MLDIFLKLTWYNPVFMIVFIAVIWFLPGIIIRRVIERRLSAQKAKNQAEAIAKLYPKGTTRSEA